MENVFETGMFRQYRTDSLSHAMESINESVQFAEKKTTVFISHKHDDLDEIKDVIGFLEKKYNVQAYIDSRDPTMPEKTSGETASRIKNRIIKCNKFILLATNLAIESKWCNWELGFGDAQKFSKHIALFPMKPKEDATYKGSEYMSIYPHIVYRDGTTRFSDGDIIERGYYVRTPNNQGGGNLQSLENWLKNI